MILPGLKPDVPGVLGPFASDSSGDDDFVNQASGPLYADNGLLGDLFQVEAVDVTPQEQNPCFNSHQSILTARYGLACRQAVSVFATLKKSTGLLRIVGARMTSPP